jgi:hypothetical protein
LSRRLAAITTWLLLGDAVVFGLFWMLLQVPESTTLMLAVSALLSLLAVLGAAAVQSGAMGAWDTDRPIALGLRTGVGRALMTLPAAALFALVWWLTGQAFDWHARVSGQVDAAVIATTGSPATAWLHASVRWLIVFVRWTLGLTLAVSLLGALVREGLTALGRTGWLRHALRPRPLLLVTLWFAVLDVLPWRFVYWRPAQLSVALEPWFVAAKLTGIALLMAAGWALVLREGRPR